ncbi:MAG TPA: glycosyltransferase family 4 protein [Alphaproteobacteria bacterium]|nr:glycosyltransferase family 4 protein [Alphaproteobacteria bacterium]
MTVCIQYSRPISGKNDGEIFGLDVAVSNFLTAYFKHSNQQQFICRPTDFPSFDHFKALAKAVGVDEQRCVGLDPRHPKHNLGSIDTLFRPDPLIADLAWRRQQLPSPGFATCGLVHTMSGERIARAVGELLTAPTDENDALICPSEAIRDAIHNMWEIQADYLNHRSGGKFKCPVQTPVIPLGIDTDKFLNLTTADKRTAQRKALDVNDDEVVVLFIGRLSFATKAHPLALWQAAERAAQHLQKKLRIIMYGYFKPGDMEQHFRKLAAETAKNITIEFVMNDDKRFPDGLWAAGDIFTSLSDNIQESFGLTPVEAMACGLPAIITDWDGYRGSVRDGLDGFLIPTMTPPPSAGLAIAEAYYNEENYGVSLMGAAQSTSIDIDACAKAIGILAGDEGRRKSFGDNARTRAQHIFDWRHIIKAYEELWTELSAKRKASKPKPALPANWQAVHPSYPNPWQMFRSFPSSLLTMEDKLTIAMSKDEITALTAHEMNYFIPELLVPKETMLEMIELVRKAGSPRVQDIVSAFPPPEHDRILRCIGWMLKHGIATTGRP